MSADAGDEEENLYSYQPAVESFLAEIRKMWMDERDP